MCPDKFDVFFFKRFVSILVLQSSQRGRESWLLCFVCLPGYTLVVWLFPMVPRVCQQFMIVVFPDHTHYFCKRGRNTGKITAEFL